MTSATALKFPVAPGSLELAKSEVISRMSALLSEDKFNEVLIGFVTLSFLTVVNTLTGKDTAINATLELLRTRKQ